MVEENVFYRLVTTDHHLLTFFLDPTTSIVFVISTCYVAFIHPIIALLIAFCIFNEHAMLLPRISVASKVISEIHRIARGTTRITHETE